jgi:site-specific recombinase XerD
LHLFSLKGGKPVSEDRSPKKDITQGEAYLRALSLAAVPEEKKQWYVRWIDRFEAFLGEKPLDAADREDAEAFIASLGRRPGTEPWQIRQATDAVRILLTTVFSKSWLPRGSVSPGGGGGDPLDLLETICRSRHYSPRTERAYAHWARRFLAFCRERGIDAPDTDACRAFLEHLVLVGRVAAATQAQALNALAFYFNQVAGTGLGDLGNFEKSKRARRLPVVLTRQEVNRLFEAMDEGYRLMAGLLYGGGLRLMEVVRLRVKDLDLERRQIVVRDGKGRKDRLTVLPERYRSLLAAHLEHVRKVHARDLERGHADVSTTMIYTHVLNRPGLAVRSPADG